ncbi:MAG: hypothetical protein IH602_16145 [Bryobacteraceae bacterium]|jgi:hypothetical protein|nr:hypothetical protein [Bryobacteraceae bacterium]
MANPTPEAVEREIPQAIDLGELSDGTKIRRRAPRMRACSLKDAKGKLCAGHLKRYYFFGEELQQKFGAEAEIYRCEKCKTIYLPSEEESPRSQILSF